MVSVKAMLNVLTVNSDYVMDMNIEGGLLWSKLKLEKSSSVAHKEDVPFVSSFCSRWALKVQLKLKGT
jgi:hypothetical protein